MGQYKSKNGGVSCGIIGSEDLAQIGLPDVNDSRWTKAGIVSKLYVYPIKSLNGLAVSKAKVEQHGLSFEDYMDRQFMIIDEKSNFVTGRQYPKLSLIQVIPRSNGFILKANGMDDFYLDLPISESSSKELVQTMVWGKKCEGIDVGPEVGQWIGSFLEKPDIKFKLLYHEYSHKISSRESHSPHLKPLMPMAKEKEDVPLFADGFGYLLTNEDSIIHLNEKLKAKNVNLIIDERRFRPNICVKETNGAFCEDDWLYIKINGVIFRPTKLCTRCIYTTVDPDLGIKDPNGEPLKTLKTFRTSLDPKERKEYQNSPFFGVNLGVDTVSASMNGFVHVNDEVYVIQNPPTAALLWHQTSFWNNFLCKWIPISLITVFIMHRGMK